MYDRVIDKVKELGDSLIPVAGKIANIAIKKDWLTEHDLRIEKELSELITTFGADHEVFAEEDHDIYKAAENVWIIDPISHTFSFLHGLPHYTVVVSHMYKGEVIFTLIYDPTGKELFSAQLGKGAYLDGGKINVNEDFSNVALLYDPFQHFHYPKDKNLALMSELMEVGRIKTIGSWALDYAYIAAGRAHGGVNLNKDTFTEFAGELLLKEAGGILTDFHGGKIGLEPKGSVSGSKSMHAKLQLICEKYY